MPLTRYDIEKCILIFFCRIAEKRHDYYNFFYAQIQDHRAKINYQAEEYLDYAEAYLKEQKNQEQGGLGSDLFSDQQLANMCFDLWFAGLTTTNTTINWTISYVLNHPEVQDKMQEELDKVVGSDRLVTISDKSSLPYMNAVINESQRCVNLLPCNLFHATTRDTVINGNIIPKGTGVIAQISTVMLDEKVLLKVIFFKISYFQIFPDPYKFQPERFIDENGALKKIEQLIPFSVGKRQCLGEGLARMELFLIVANLFNRYFVISRFEPA